MKGRESFFGNLPKCLTAVAMLILAGCAATEVAPEAKRIRFMQSEPQGCEYLGEATGNQGNFFTGGWTSNKNLETGARNELKNEAAKLGGNVVVLLTNRSGQTGSGGRLFVHSEQTNVVITGTVFKCPLQTLSTNRPTEQRALPLKNQSNRTSNKFRTAKASD